MKIKVKMLTDAAALLAVTLVLTMALLPTVLSASEKPASQIEESDTSEEEWEELSLILPAVQASGKSASSLRAAVLKAKREELQAEAQTSVPDETEEPSAEVTTSAASTMQQTQAPVTTSQTTTPPQTAQTEATRSEEAVSGTMYVNTDGIYSREVAVVGSARIRQYALNEAVTVVALTDTGYYKLEDGTFIHADYLSSTPLAVTTVPETEHEPEPDPEPETQPPETETSEAEPVPLSAQPEVQSAALEMFRLVNEYRAQYGLQPLQWDYNAYPAAQIRAGELLQNNSHTRPNGKRFSTVYDDIGYSPSASGENIVYYYNTAASAFNSLVSSASHRAIMLSTDYTHIAIAYTYDAGSYWGYYWVQEFTRP